MASARRQSAATAITALVVGAVLALTLGTVASAQTGSTQAAAPAPADTTPPAQIPAAVASAVAARPTDVLVSFDPAAGVHAMQAASTAYPDASHREQGIQAASSSYAKTKDAALQRAGSGASTKRDFDHLPVQLVHITTPAALQRLASDPDVTSLNLPQVYVPAVDADLTQVNQPPAIANGLTGAGTRVAVLDTGIDINQGAFGTCPAVDDSLTGACHVSRRSVISGNPTGDVDTSSHHGTNVAGIVIKMAPDVRIDDYQVFSNTPSGLTSSDTTIISALNAVVADGASRNVKAVNLSVDEEGDYHTAECTSSTFSSPFTSLRAAGIVPVVASGNDAFKNGHYTDGVSEPACATGALRVGAEWDTAFGGSGTFNPPPSIYACTQSSVPAKAIGCFSQSGAGGLLSVYAPGVQITAAGQTLSGTSQATPHVSGAIADLATLVPAATAQDLFSAVTTSATQLTDARVSPSRQTPLLDLTRAANELELLQVQAPATATAGTPISVVVTAVNGHGVTQAGVAGALTVTSSDPGAALPTSPPTLVSGTVTFSVSFMYNGAQTVAVTGPHGLVGISGPITVSGGVTTTTVAPPTTTTTTAPTTTTTTAPPPTPATISRLSGADRIATSVAASQASFPAADSAGAVVLASGDSYPDGLAGTPLAASLHAPLLLSSAGSLRNDVLTEINRALPAGGNVYALGGTASLSTAVTDALTQAGYQVHRIAGPDRYGTATAIADTISSPTTVLLATGLNFPDALAAGVAAAHAHGVVLFTQGTTQASATQTWLSAHASLPVVIVGGSAAGTSSGATTLAGTDRYDTSVKVAEHFFTGSVPIAAVASGLVFPDALSGGSHIASLGGPILLTQTSSLPSTVSAWFTTHRDDLTTVYLYGGTATVAAAVGTQVANATG